MPLQFDLNSKQTAKLLDKSQKTVLRWAKEGRLSFMTVHTEQRDYFRFNGDEVRKLQKQLAKENEFIPRQKTTASQLAHASIHTNAQIKEQPTPVTNVMDTMAQTAEHISVRHHTQPQAEAEQQEIREAALNEIRQVQQALLSKLEGAGYRLERVEKILESRTRSPRLSYRIPIPPESMREAPPQAFGSYSLPPRLRHLGSQSSALYPPHSPLQPLPPPPVTPPPLPPNTPPPPPPVPRLYQECVIEDKKTQLVMDCVAELKADNIFLKTKLSQERSFTWILAVLVFILIIEFVIYWAS